MRDLSNIIERVKRIQWIRKTGFVLSVGHHFLRLFIILCNLVLGRNRNFIQDKQSGKKVS